MVCGSEIRDVSSLGLYSIPARGEWMRSFEKLTDEEYERYFREFDPVDYDPKKNGQRRPKKPV